MSPILIGGLVVGVSLVAATIFCTGLCLALWYRRLRGQAGDPSPATFLVSKRKPGQYAAPDHPMAFVMPTITSSDAGSEPQTPTPTQILTPTERSKTIAKSSGGSSISSLSPSRPTQANPEDHPNVQRWDALVTTSRTPPPAYSPPPPGGRSNIFCTSPPLYTPIHSLRPRSASPKGLVKPSQRNPPLSLPVGGSRWTPRAAKRPRSASPKILKPTPKIPPPVPPRPYQTLNSRTPPGLPPRSIFFRRVSGDSDEVRNSLQPRSSFDEEGSDLADVTTPDSIDGWGPIWTPASSIASGGGCGLGELQVRLRYSMRTRLLRLTILSADNLPLRLGPEPVDTYTKAVLLPDKRVRFSTRPVPAVRNAHFHASFTHAARPGRLAQSTLRFSVCQVTACGKRVVLGYAALTLSSTGLRSGLNHDLDTGSLTLHLQESAPDQQVGMGGQLQIGLKWDNDANELTISIFHLMGLQYDQNSNSQEVQVYIKVTVYTNNTILCWRRTTPRTMEAEATLFEEDLILRMPELDLDATHFVLSARERTGPGCGRRVLGSCVVGRGSCVGDEGRHHWIDMLRAAPEIVVRTHMLSALSPYQTPAFQQNPPAYQNVFPGPSPYDIDLPIYHRYENIGLIPGQSYPVIEIPGPDQSSSEGGTPREQCLDQEDPSSDDCHSSEIPTPDTCLSPEATTDEGQDVESHHSGGQMSSDQSHYSEISIPDQFPREESFSQDQSSEALLSRQDRPASTDPDDTTNGNRGDIEKQTLKTTGEGIYYNQPSNTDQLIKEDTPKKTSEPIYAKPDLTLKRNYMRQSVVSDVSSIPSTASRHSYQSSDCPSEPIYESPELIRHRIYSSPEVTNQHIYEKVGEVSHPVYENANLVPQNIYQVPDLSVPHAYQDPNFSSAHHIYATPDISSEHIYQMPYEASLRRYQNIDAVIEAAKSEYQNITPTIRRGERKRRYVNVPEEQQRERTLQQQKAAKEDPTGEHEESEPRREGDSTDDEQAELSPAREQERPVQKGFDNYAYDNSSDTSDIYHDARSSTKSDD